MSYTKQCKYYKREEQSKGTKIMGNCEEKKGEHNLKFRRGGQIGKCRELKRREDKLRSDLKWL